ncbi:MAG: Holliday junction resolvase RuvX [Gemmatimonadota bacterium]
MARILAIDYGERRVGLAISDPSATIAQPLPTLVRRTGKRPPVSKILDIVAANQVREIVVGLPLSLAGEDTEWTRAVRDFARTLEARAGTPVTLLDERLTSVRAERAVRELGLKKSQREQKERIDAAAAQLLLQQFLDQRKAT